MTTGPEPICVTCKHWHQDNTEAMTCDAFPNGIPMPIILNAADHRKPYPGDHGIRYEPLPGKKPATE